jgi:hypothetical protein
MGVTQSYTLFVAHAVEPNEALQFSHFSRAGRRNYCTRWNHDTVRRMTRRIYADMGSEGIDVCRKSGADVPQFAKPSLPAFRRVIRNCTKLAHTLIPQELRDELFRNPDHREPRTLTIIVPLSLYFIPWELMSDGDTFLAERFGVWKMVA